MIQWLIAVHKFVQHCVALALKVGLIIVMAAQCWVRWFCDRKSRKYGTVQWWHLVLPLMSKLCPKVTYLALRFFRLFLIFNCYGCQLLMWCVGCRSVFPEKKIWQCIVYWTVQSWFNIKPSRARTHTHPHPFLTLKSRIKSHLLFASTGRSPPFCRR